MALIALGTALVLFSVVMLVLPLINRGAPTQGEPAPAPTTQPATQAPSTPTSEPSASPTSEPPVGPAKRKLVWKRDGPGSLMPVEGTQYGLHSQYSLTTITAMVDLRTGKARWVKEYAGACFAWSGVYCLDGDKVHFLDFAAEKLIKTVPAPDARAVVADGAGLVAVLSKQGEKFVVTVYDELGTEIWKKAVGGIGDHVSALSTHSGLLAVEIDGDGGANGFLMRDGTELFKGTGSIRATSFGLAFDSDAERLLIKKDGTKVKLALPLAELTTNATDSVPILFEFGKFARVDENLEPIFTYEATPMPMLACGDYTVLASDDYAETHQIEVVGPEGKQVWQKKLDAVAYPATCQGSGFIMAQGRNLIGVDLTSGKELWRVPLGAMSTHALETEEGTLVMTQEGIEWYR